MSYIKLLYFLIYVLVRRFIYNIFTLTVPVGVQDEAPALGDEVPQELKNFY